ncbi:glycosyltransferase family 2 protein [Planctomyces sp. SH-PL62]|uniref:glycosyltransferase family 2 protein n=1 Tax=Planctomyces sp. SH-PL62 TaxID=1636152 RepID=UPI00078D5333|nr:glycosyltransferase family 2 protein [Planctomyces sp. SH-PL62]AMV40850.1 N-acetylglucosaminyl-diphospho-decaprenol L-rhamnosyltransferase [Planctomyces sp. SH-PL62]
MKLLVVVLCYKVPDLTIDCLRSLEPEIARIPGARVGVCENGTGPEAAERIRRAIDANGWGSWVDLTVVEINRGFCGGNNLVIREALASDDPPEYVILLNADTIVHEGAMASLVAFMDAHPRAGIAGSRLLSAEGELQASPFRFQGIATEFDRGLRLGLLTKVLAPPLAVDLEAPSRAEWVSGASMILRTSMLERIGLLDEGLYTYFDDIDMGLRAKAAGWEVWYVPESQVIHLEGASTGVGEATPQRVKRRPAYWFQARRRCFLKNYGKAYTALADAAFLAGFAAWRLRRRIQRHPDRDPEHFLADSFRHSVFRTGFQIREVENPALAGASKPEPTPAP